MAETWFHLRRFHRNELRFLVRRIWQFVLRLCHHNTFRLNKVVHGQRISKHLHRFYRAATRCGFIILIQRMLILHLRPTFFCDVREHVVNIALWTNFGFSLKVFSYLSELCSVVFDCGILWVAFAREWDILSFEKRFQLSISFHLPMKSIK